MAVKQAFLDVGGGEVDVSIAAPMPVTDSRFQIQVGNVEGFELLVLPGENFDVLKDTFIDLTPTGGQQSFPTSAETWEIVSSNANDTALGTGARTVIIVSLDADYKLQSTVAILNGTTPVTLTGLHFRTRNATVLTAGSIPTNTNIGDLSIRVSGGGTERMKIPKGIGDCKSLIYTVPVGKSSFVQQITLFCRKNEDCIFETLVTPLNGATVISSRLSTYQNSQIVRVAGKIALPQKTDVVVRVRSSTNSNTSLAFFTVLEVENNLLANPPINPVPIP